MIPPQGTSSPGDVTTPVTDTPVLVQDPSPVSNDALPSSSAPATQEGTAADPMTVSVEVYEVPESEQDEHNMSEDPLTALAHMSLGTQTFSELPRQEDSQSPSWEITGNPGRTLTLDPAKPIAEIVGRLRFHLSPTWGYASGGVRVPFLDSNDLVALEGYVDQLRWVNLPSLQPKQVDHAGVACLVQALQGTVFHLNQSEDNESDTSSVETTDSSQPWHRSEQDPLGLTQGDPAQEEGEWTSHSSSPEAMDQDKVLEHDAHLDEGSASEAGLAFGQRTDSQSEEMDVTTRYLEHESYSGQPMETQDARYSRGNPESKWGERETEMAKRKVPNPRYGPTRSLCSRTSITGGTKGRT